MLSLHTSDGCFSSFYLYLNETVKVLTKVYGPVISRGSLEVGREELGWGALSLQGSPLEMLFFGEAS